MTRAAVTRQTVKKSKLLSIFIIVLRQSYLPISLSLCNACTMQFPGGYTTCHDFITLRANAMYEADMRILLSCIKPGITQFEKT